MKVIAIVVSVAIAAMGCSSPSETLEPTPTGPPNTPSVTAVSFAVTGDSLGIVSTAFRGAATDLHESTAIQVDTAGGDFSDPKYHNVTLGAVLTDTVPQVDPGAVVTTRVRHKGTSGGWSNWSTTTATAMLAAAPPGPPATPTHNAGTFGTSGDRIRIVTSPFVANGFDTHDSTAVQVDTAGGNFSAPKYANVLLGAVLTDTITALDSGAVVLSRVRHKAVTGGWSGWSTAESTSMAVAAGVVFGANMPPALSDTVVDYSFSGTHAGGDVTNLNGSGISVTDWNARAGDECHIVSDATSPEGPNVWESKYGTSHSGSGPCALNVGLTGSRDTAYVAVWTKYSAGWQANSTSQKIIYWNTTAGQHRHLMEYTYGDEAVNLMRSATGCDYLEANQANAGSAGHSPPCSGQRSTEITDGDWDHWEFLMIASSGTVKWWKNGELRGSHIGRSFSPVTGFELPDTWGGGGNLTQRQNRRYARIMVVVSAN